MLARGTNGVGMAMDEWCPSPWILIDRTPPSLGRAIVVRNTDDAFLESPPDAPGQHSTEWVYLTLRECLAGAQPPVSSDVGLSAPSVCASASLAIPAGNFTDEQSGMYGFYVSVVGLDGWPVAPRPFFHYTQQHSLIAFSWPRHRLSILWFASDSALFLPRHHTSDRLPTYRWCQVALEQFFRHSSLIQFPVALKHRQAIQVHVRAVNNAGLVATATSESVVVDATPPAISFVSDFGTADEDVDVVKGPDVDWVVVWEAYDEESGIEDLEVCLGSFPRQCDLTGTVSVENQR